jgi:hypothetical protein
MVVTLIVESAIDALSSISVSGVSPRLLSYNELDIMGQEKRGTYLEGGRLAERMLATDDGFLLDVGDEVASSNCFATRASEDEEARACSDFFSGFAHSDALELLSPESVRGRFGAGPGRL